MFRFHRFAQLIMLFALSTVTAQAATMVWYNKDKSETTTQMELFECQCGTSPKKAASCMSSRGYTQNSEKAYKNKKGARPTSDSKCPHRVSFCNLSGEETWIGRSSEEFGVRSTTRKPIALQR
jgi:hypothetical protein